MSEILSIEQLKELSTTVIEIPDFDNEGTIKVRVRKPRLMAMASQGQIPNHLLGVVNDMIFGQKNKQKELKIEDITNVYELYCTACLVEPNYEEFKEIITDDQMEAIFDFGMGTVNKLDTFRDDQENGSDNNNGEEVQQEAE